MPFTLTGNIKGPTGLTGPSGPSGPAGVNAYTTCTAGFTVPAVGSSITINVVNTSWVVLNEILWIQDAGGPGVGAPMKVTAISPTSLTLLNYTA